MEINREIKQVIVMRNDLGMRKGKMIAQGAHASIAFLASLVMVGPAVMNSNQWEWLRHGMTKICVRADSETELLEIYEKAKDAGLTVHLITDAGLTEFDGPTRTCLAIGPDHADKIDPITGSLKLL
jgi:PTH2 family peptidyl-tRNA hydrolase